MPRPDSTVLAATVVAEVLAKLPPAERPRFLHALVDQTFAGLIVIEGPTEAYEKAVMVSEAIMAQGRRFGPLKELDG